jgi:anti-anti-sigma factor
MRQAIRIEERSSGDGVLVTVAGWLVAGPAGDRLRARLRRSLARGARRLIIDLSRVRRMDCSGLGLLLACRKEAARRGARFRVTRSRGAIREMLRLASLLSPLEEGAAGTRGRAGHDIPLLLSA